MRAGPEFILAVFKMAEKGYNKNMDQKQNSWLFGLKKFVFIEFIFIILFELSRLTVGFGWLNNLCGSGSPARIYPSGSGVPQIIPNLSCSGIFGRLGMKIFLLLFIVYLISFIIHKIIKKDFKSTIFPIVIITTFFFVVDWAVKNFL